MKKLCRNLIILLFGLIMGFMWAQPLSARVVAVQNDQVNIRQGASTETASIAKVKKGALFAWQGAADGWTQIIYTDGQSGYIRNDLLKGYDDVVVTGSSVRIRQNPSLQGAILESAKSGDRLEALDYEKDWFKVRYGQTVGWISGDYVKLGTAVDLPSAFGADVSGASTAPTPVDGAATALGHNFDSVTVSTGAAGGILSGVVVTLDPGHGALTDGKPIDPGAQSAALKIWEKDVNLDIALKLRNILENMGATIWMTHSGSTNLNLNGRAAVANRNGSHLFISIHANSSENLALNGHSVYFYAPANDLRLSGQRNARQALARSVQHNLTKTCGRADLGIKESNFAVLRETNCPSILIETAFLSHVQEELLLAQGAFRQKLAEAIAAGVTDYLGFGSSHVSFSAL